MESSMDTILKVDNVSKSFDGVRALIGVSLEIKRGEIHCLAGENGCGKSTLIKIVSGDYTADSGTICIQGSEFKKLTPIESINMGVQVIYQDFAVMPNLSVMENIAATQFLMNKRKLVNWKQYRKIAEEAVNRIGFKVDLDEKIENLSVADKQLVAISRALFFNAKLIIMDEPTTALTKKEVSALFAIAKQLKEENISILFVSHKLEEVYEICDRITILRNGQNVITTEIGNIDRKNFAYYMTGREFEQEQFKCDLPGEVAIKVESLSHKGAYEDISFEVKKGEIFGVTGLLGSGRNELALTLLGLLNADSGKIYVNGEEASIKCVADSKHYGIGYVPEDRTTEGLFLPQSVRNNMTISVIDKYTDSKGFYNNGKLARMAGEWREKLRIKARNLNDPVATLSGGNQQKVVLAKCIAADLSILILNGPTVGVDIGSKYDIHQLLRQFAAKGIAIIMITDDLNELLTNCNRIMILRGGRMVCEMDTSVCSEQDVTAVIGGGACMAN